jgi:thiol-disulfide isomerase/thioredoxin
MPRQTRFRNKKGKNTKKSTRRKRARLSSIKLKNTPKMVTFDELNVYNNKRKLDKKTLIIGIVYAKWCPHCKDLIPEEGDTMREPKWDNMIQLIKNDAKDLDIAHIKLTDTETQKLEKLNEKCKDISDIPIEPEGYPTLFKITGGKLDKYTGERTPQAMANWYLNKSGGYVY